MKAIIFDLDGVLVFTDQYHYKAWKKMADALGIYFDETINERLRGVSRRESLEILLERYEGTPLKDEQKEALMAYKNKIYRGFLEKMTPQDVAWDTRQMLCRLKTAGYKLAVGSSSKNTRFILKQTDIESYFSAVIDGTDITRSKPDPEVFLKAAELLDETPENCIVVEDAAAGIDAAKAAGMTAVGIGNAKKYEKCDRGIKRLDMLEVLLQQYF